MSIAERPN